MATNKERKRGLAEWQEPDLSIEPRMHWGFFDLTAPVKISTPERPSNLSTKPSRKNEYYALVTKDKIRQDGHIQVLSLPDSTSHTHRPQYSLDRAEALTRFRQSSPKRKPVQPAVVLSEEIIIAFKGWVDQVTDGIATLRLIDGEGRRSTAKYAVADLERDNIPVQVGAAFRCQVIRHPGGFDISFQPVSRRVVSEARRKQLEDATIAAYSTLKNDY